MIARGNRGFENYFINGRYVRSSLIYKAIEMAYKPFMMQHRYPFTVLYMTLDSDDVDVNVHPAKMELRFKNEIVLYDALVQGITSALDGKEFIPEVSLEQDKKEERSVFKAPEPFEKKRMEMQQDEKKPVAEKKANVHSSVLREKGDYSAEIPIRNRFNPTNSVREETEKKKAIFYRRIMWKRLFQNRRQLWLSQRKNRKSRCKCPYLKKSCFQKIPDPVIV